MLNKGLPPTRPCYHFLEETTNVEIALCLPSNASLNLFQSPMGLSIRGVCWRPFGTSKCYKAMHIFKEMQGKLLHAKWWELHEATWKQLFLATRFQSNQSETEGRVAGLIFPVALCKAVVLSSLPESALPVAHTHRPASSRLLALVLSWFKNNWFYSDSIHHLE